MMGQTYRNSMPRRNKLIPSICRPKALIVIALVLCWNSKNGSFADNNHHHNLRLRAPSNYLNDPPFGTMPLKGSEYPSEETNVVGPFIGNIADAGGMLSPKQKKSCSEPSIAARGLVGPTLKRSFFATTKEEMDEKIRKEGREKREVKRSETNEPSLPWTCETRYEWHDMGADHYPRFVRTAECKTKSCFNGFFRCRPRRYKTKVLKRVAPSDSTSCEEDDVSLPESLRSQWRFITVTISLCCDCVGRIPGSETPTV